jgi:hypothetical protein
VKKPDKKSGCCERGKTIIQEVKAADKKAKDTKVVLKKDGTPDKRYKEAKEVVLKKDGTPDKRFKK